MCNYITHPRLKILVKKYFNMLMANKWNSKDFDGINEI
jgi:hypothetical protein